MTYESESDTEGKWYKQNSELDRLRWYLDEARMRLDMEKDFGPFRPLKGECQWPDWALKFARRLEWT